MNAIPAGLAARLYEYADEIADGFAHGGPLPFATSPDEVLADLRQAARLAEAGPAAVAYVPVLAAAKFRIVCYQRIKLLRAEVELERAVEGMSPELEAEYNTRTEPILAETEAALAAIEARAAARRERLAARPTETELAAAAWYAAEAEPAEPGAIADARRTREHMREWAAGTESHPGEFGPEVTE